MQTNTYLYIQQNHTLTLQIQISAFIIKSIFYIFVAILFNYFNQSAK